MTQEIDLGTVVLIGVLLARLLVPLLIPTRPLPGIIAALLIDGADQSLFQLTIGGELAGYQTYDKALDVYYLAVAYASTLRNWDRGPSFAVGRFLWYYRLLGVVLFESTGERWLLLVFPNTFEYFFIAIEAMKIAWNPFRLGRRHVIALAAAIWIPIKLPQEWWIHIAGLDLTDMLKGHVFGVPLSSTWGEAFANRPLVLVMGAAAAVAVGILTRLLAPRLPPRDWRPTASADEQARELGWGHPAPVGPSATWGWPFVEKVALVAGVGFAFGQVLPGADRNPIQVAVGAAVIIGLSTFVSQLLARTGVTWRSTAIQFVAMSIGNIATVLGIGLVLPFERVPQPTVAAIFLVELLTLIVLLYDRSRAIGRERSNRARQAD